LLPDELPVTVIVAGLLLVSNVSTGEVAFKTPMMFCRLFWPLSKLICPTVLSVLSVSVREAVWIFEKIAVSSAPLGTLAGLQLAGLFQSAGVAAVAAKTVVVTVTAARAGIAAAYVMSKATVPATIEKRIIAYLRKVKRCVIWTG
jgi:hypothetical protein